MPLAQLPDALDKFSVSWGRPRGDLCLWISVLNRHDLILKDMISKYRLEQGTIRPEPFESDDEKLIISIFKFTSFILSNSSNRGIFASEKYIMPFLNTISPAIISSALKVCVALAVHHSHSKFIRGYYQNSEINVILKYGLFLSSIFGESTPETCLVDFHKNVNAPSGFSVQYYAKGNKSTAASTMNPMSTQNLATGSPNGGKSSEGLTEYVISTKDATEQELHIVLQKAFSVIPETQWLDAMLKTFVARSTAKSEDGKVLRNTLLEIQCDALTTSAYSFSLNTLENKILADHPNIIPHLVPLILPEHDIAIGVRVAAIDAFCALAYQIALIPVIVMALSSHVNHGPIMIVLRDVIKRLKQGEVVDQDFIDGLTSLIAQISNMASGTATATTSDMIPLFVELIRVGSNIPRARSNALDALMHILPDSPTIFNAFVHQEKGNELLMQFLKEAVESYLIPENRGTPPKYCVVDYSISYYNQQWLKNVIQMITNTVSQSRASERIQLLFESPFMGLATELIKQPQIYGSRIIIFALTAIGNMLESESSTYAMLSEKGYLDEIFNSIPVLLEYSTSFYGPIAKFLSSLAYNEAGIAAIKEKELFQFYFSTIRRNIVNKDGLKHLGFTLDHICTEHNTLRPLIITESLKLLNDLKSTLDKEANTSWLLHEMDHASQDEPDAEELSKTKHISFLVASISFVESLLKNHFSRVEFIKQKGVETLLSFFELKSLPYDFGFSPPAMALCLTVKQLFDLDIDREYVSQALFSSLEQAICRIENAQKQIDQESEADVFDSYSYQDYLNSLIPFNNLMHALYVTVFTNYGTGYRICALLNHLGEEEISNFVSNEDEMVEEPHRPERNLIARLGKLQRQALWEESRISKYISNEVRDATRPASLSAFLGSPFKRLQDSNEAKKLKELESKLTPEQKTPRFNLIKSSRFLLNGVTSSTSKILYEIASHISQDRQKEITDKHAYLLTELIAEVFVDHLNKFDTSSTSQVQLSYLVNCLNCLQKVMYWNSHRTVGLCKSIFIFFKQRFGIMKMCAILKCLFSRTEANDSNSESLTVVAIKILLILMSYMVSAKSVLEYNFTFGRTWGQHEDPLRPNYFLIHVFFLECRLTVFDTLIDLWLSKDIFEKPSSITSLITSVVTSALLTTGDEQVRDSTAGGMVYLNWKETWPAETVVNAYVDKGYSKERVVEAFKEANQNYRKLFESLEQIKLDELDFPVIPVTVPAGSEGPLHSFNNLTAQRAKILDNGFGHACDILSDHPENVFVIATFLEKFIPSQASSKISKVSATDKLWIEKIFTRMKPLDIETSSKSLTSLLHLVGILLGDHITLVHALDTLIQNLPFLTQLIGFSGAVSKEWFPHVLLILETIFSIKDFLEDISEQTEKRSSPLSKDSTVLETKAIAKPVSDEVFKALLKIEDLSHEWTTVSISRLLVLFTRNFDRAATLRNSPLLLLLLRSVKAFSLKNTNEGALFNQLRSSIIMILRNLVETPEIVREIMKRDIEKHFATHSPSQTDDLYSFVNSHSSLIARSSPIFIEVMTELCTLEDFSEPVDSRSTTVCLKERHEKKNEKIAKRFKEIVEKAVPQATQEETASDVSMEDVESPKDTRQEVASTPVRPHFIGSVPNSSFKTPNLKISVDKTSRIINLLVSEIMSLSREDIFTVSEKSEEALRRYNAEQIQNSQSTGNAENKKPSSKEGFHYACFLLQSVTELVGSYTACKLDFINFTKMQDIQGLSSQFKPRTLALKYFFNELMPTGVLSSHDVLPALEWSQISSLSSVVISNLLTCTDERSRYNVKEEEVQNDSQLVLVRRFVIDSIARAFKQVTKSTNSLEWRYSSLTALSELCYKVIAARNTRSSGNFSFNSVGSADGNAIAKIVYQKNFAAIFTGCLSEIDLNYPESKRPVRSLTKSINMLSRLSMEVDGDGNPELAEAEEIENEIGEFSEEEDYSDGGGTGIFRNSTLGMYEANEDHDWEAGEMMEGEYADHNEAEEEMDYDDNDEPQSDVDSDVSGSHPVNAYPDDEDISLVDEFDELTSDNDSGDDEDEEIEDVCCRTISFYQNC